MFTLIIYFQKSINLEELFSCSIQKKKKKKKMHFNKYSRKITKLVRIQKINTNREKYSNLEMKMSSFTLLELNLSI